MAAGAAASRSALPGGRVIEGKDSGARHIRLRNRTDWVAAAANTRGIKLAGSRELLSLAGFPRQASSFQAVLGFVCPAGR